MRLSRYISQADPILAIDSVFNTSTIAASPASFGLTATIAGQLSAYASAYEASYQNLLSAESAYKKAIEEKNAEKARFAELYSRYLTQSYATPSVTDAALASIGLDPKPVRGPVTSPTTPLDLLAEAFSNGYVKFKWKRNGNSNATTFNVEAKIEDGAWDLIWSGPRTKLELSGFAPGTQVAFRVYASKGDEQSAPSNIAVIYEEGGSSELQFAA
jgi:hypothetical protein